MIIDGFKTIQINIQDSNPGLASLSLAELEHALGFMVIGFLTNLVIGITAYVMLRQTKLRKIDAATVAGYYGSDSAGTFVTCLGVLAAANIAFAAYMPVLLAVMEIPGCLVALYIVARLRSSGKLDIWGNTGVPNQTQDVAAGIWSNAGSDGELRLHARKGIT